MLAVRLVGKADMGFIRLTHVIQQLHTTAKEALHNWFESDGWNWRGGRNQGKKAELITEMHYFN